MTGKYPPGPRDGFLGITLLRQFQKSPMQFVADVARRYGDFTFVRFGWVRFYMINRPELIREVLVSKLRSFHKLGRIMRALRKIEGNGLVAAEGEPWKRHRPVVQVAFHNRHMGRFGRIMVEHTRRRIDRWTPGKSFDLAEEMNQLALEIVADVVFNVDWADRAEQLRDAVHAAREAMQREIANVSFSPEWVPWPWRLRQRRALRTIDDLIWGLIRERRAAQVVKEDMLSLMLAASADVSAGPPISDREIRDEAATLFVAGHDTTSAALAWFWYLLARNPQHEQRIRDEVDRVLQGRAATYEDAARLSYTEMAVRESMRLYPAAGFLFGREAIEDVEIGGYPIQRGSWIFIAPYVVHRDPQYFKDPETFDPERFSPGRVDEIPAYAYIPFGGGPRICIGNNFAITEIVLVAATIVQRFQLVLEQPDVEPELEVVLRPKGGLRMRAIPGQTSSASASPPLSLARSPS